jgi:hypothetical protein
LGGGRKTCLDCCRRPTVPDHITHRRAIPDAVPSTRLAGICLALLSPHHAPCPATSRRHRRRWRDCRTMGVADPVVCSHIGRQSSATEVVDRHLQWGSAIACASALPMGKSLSRLATPPRRCQERSRRWHCMRDFMSTHRQADASPPPHSPCPRLPRSSWSPGNDRKADCSSLPHAQLLLSPGCASHWLAAVSPPICCRLILPGFVCCCPRLPSLEL